MRTGKYLFFWIACLFLLYGCPEKPPPAPPPVVERIEANQLPDLNDDEQLESLRPAILASLAWYDRTSPEKIFELGPYSLNATALKDSLVHLLRLLDSNELTKETLARDFDILKIVPPEGSKLLVTGYYEPVLEGSLKPDDKYRWPLYGLPPDLLTIDLEMFNHERFKGERLIGRVDKNRVVPYYTRAEIDGKNKLKSSVKQLAWLRDPVDCFFLHVQGSGMISLAEGGSVRVGYAGANGRPYRSIGKTLIEKGVLTREEMSMQAIRKYLVDHPEQRDAIMWENESYVFFRFVTEGPLGSLGKVLTPGRSVASDPKFHPRGAMAFLVSEKPRFGPTGQIEGWERFGRWVLHQDTGGAIKGAGRIDLFCGTGEKAEQIAGPMKQPGEMYYFIKKGDLLRSGGRRSEVGKRNKLNQDSYFIKAGAPKIGNYFRV